MVTSSRIVLLCAFCFSLLTASAQSDEAAKANFESLISEIDSMVYDRPEEAIIKAVQALDIARSKLTRSDEAIALNRLGGAFWSKGELALAMRNHQESRQIAEEVGDLDLVARNLGNIGNVYTMAGLNSTAIDFLKQGLEIFMVRENSSRIFVFYNNIGKAYMDNNEFDSAQMYFDKALEMRNEELEKMLPTVLFNRGELAYKRGNNKTADSLITVANHLAIQYDDKRILCRSTQIKAELKLLAGESVEAMVLAKEAYNMANATKVVHLMDIASATLARAFMSNGLSNRAYEMLEQSRKFNDYLENDLVKNQLELLRHEQDQATIQLLEERNASARGLTRIQRFVIIALALLILIFIVFGFLLYQARNNLAKQSQQLHDLSTFKTKILAIVSHDLRSPLNNCHSLVTLMEKEVDAPPEYQVFFTQIRKSMNSLLSILDSLVTWAKVPNADKGFSMVDVDISLIIQKVLVDLEQEIDEKKIKINTDLSSMNIKSDPELLRIIIRNLISNAIKFSTEESEVKVQVEERTHELEISVQDFGIGMTVEQKSGLFSYSFHTTKGTQGEKGSGIGLTLCKEFVNILGGEIYVESTPGNGSTFTIILPG